MRILLAGVYDWPPFIIAPGFSAIGVLLMAALENVCRVQFLGQHTLEEIAAEGLPSEKEAIMAPMDPPSSSPSQGSL